MRFQRLFGDTERFALSIAFRDDPDRPVGITEHLQRSWGELQLWVDGLCLTRHVHGDGTSGEGVVWYLRPFLQWLDQSAAELLNREPFAFPIQRHEGTALDWLDSASEGRPPMATDWDDDQWFDERYAFWSSHALRAGMPGAAVPHVVFHRVADDIEVSWDNEGAPPPRPGLQYTNTRGARLVNGEQFAETLRSAVRDASAWLEECGGKLDLHGPLANGQGPGEEAWRLLLPRNTAALVAEVEALGARMREAVPTHGGFVPHTLASSVLRGVETSDMGALQAVSTVLEPPAASHAIASVSSLRHASTAPRWRAWKDGYRAATRVREALGWGIDAVPDLRQRISALGIDVSDLALPSGVECAALGFSDGRARLVVGGPGHMGPAMRLAAALGHLVLDTPVDRDFGVVSSRWMDPPTVARAKAFGAMLLMPEEVCRKLAKLTPEPGTLVQKVMQACNTTRAATSWHLYHLRLLDEGDLEALLA